MSSGTLSNLSPQEFAALSRTPTIPPPPGVEPSFLTPENIQHPLIIVSSLFLALSSVFILNRAYTKTFIVRKYSWDDLTLIIGFIGTVSYSVASLWGALRGPIGKHLWDVNVIDMTSRDWLIPAYLFSVLTPPTMLFLKVTFFIMYLDIFYLMRWLKLSAYIGGIITALFYGTMTVCYFIFATPGRHETWVEHQTARGQRLDLDVSVPQSCVGLVIDLYILVLPILGVARLQMPTRRKVGVILIFMSAIMACLGSLLSIYYRRKLEQTNDITWALIPVLNVTLSELYIGTIVACMPSASRSCRHLLPSYSVLSSRISSLLGSKFKRGTPDSFKNSSSDQHNSHDSKFVAHKRPYKHLEGCQDHFPLNANPVEAKTTRTSIRGEGQGGAENDGTYLTYEMRQSDYHDVPLGRGLDSRSDAL